MTANPIDEGAPVYVISIAAQLSGLHPQTLRQYDRLGIVQPQRTGGGGRRYSARDLHLLDQVAQLSSEGLNLEGIRRVIALEDEVRSLHSQIDELRATLSGVEREIQRRVEEAHASHRRDLVPVDDAHLVMWRTRR